jgi:hypothetical protein
LKMECVGFQLLLIHMMEVNKSLIILWVMSDRAVGMEYI